MDVSATRRASDAADVEQSIEEAAQRAAEGATYQVKPRTTRRGVSNMERRVS
jgi:hypothetical protein